MELSAAAEAACYPDTVRRVDSLNPVSSTSHFHQFTLTCGSTANCGPLSLPAAMASFTGEMTLASRVSHFCKEAGDVGRGVRGATERCARAAPHGLEEREEARPNAQIGRANAASAPSPAYVVRLCSIIGAA